MNPLPFTTADAAYSAAFGTGLSNLLNSVQGDVVAPALACVTLWIMVQGILVMRGDLDARRGVNRILKIALVTTLVVTAEDYNNVVQYFFTIVVPSFVKDLSSPVTNALTIPGQLDAILDACMIEFQAIAAEIGPMNDQDAMAFQGAQFVLYGTLWSMFTIYEVTTVMTDVLLAIGPLILIGYLFDATKGIADRWIGQLITYALLLLLVTTVATIVIATEATYLTAQFVLSLLTGPTSAQIVSFYEMDMFLLTGDAFVLAWPAIAGLLGGGVALSPGEGLARIGAAGFRRASGTAGGYGGAGYGGAYGGGYGTPIASAPATASYRGTP